MLVWLLRSRIVFRVIWGQYLFLNQIYFANVAFTQEFDSWVLVYMNPKKKHKCLVYHVNVDRHNIVDLFISYSSYLAHPSVYLPHWYLLRDWIPLHFGSWKMFRPKWIIIRHHWFSHTYTHLKNEVSIGKIMVLIPAGGASSSLQTHRKAWCWVHLSSAANPEHEYCWNKNLSSSP